MQFTIDKRPECVLLRISGDLRLWTQPDSAAKLSQVLPQDLDIPRGGVILNLAGLSHIDSCGINTIVQVMVYCSKRNVEFSAILPKGVAGEAIRRTRVLASWPEFSTEEDAVAAMNAKR